MNTNNTHRQNENNSTTSIHTNKTELNRQEQPALTKWRAIRRNQHA